LFGGENIGRILGRGVFYAVPVVSNTKYVLKEEWAIPCGGGVKYLHRNPV
jgi:hypothetical protein